MIKDKLAGLPVHDMEQLNYAFEGGHAHFVKLENNEFIGVNVAHIQYLIPSESAGVWSFGYIKKLED